jgi:multisubunit Na+/H+ antiporter MnhB subunit
MAVTTGFVLLIGHYASSQKINAPKPWLSFLISGSIVLCFIAILSNQMQWPGANFLGGISLVALFGIVILCYRFRRQVLSATKRSVAILLIVAILAQFRYVRWAFFHLDFNYSRYTQTIRKNTFRSNILKSIKGSVLLETNKNNYKDSLNTYLDRLYLVQQKENLFEKEELNNLAWTLFENIDDSLSLEKVLQISYLSLDKHAPQIIHLDTYLQLQRKTKHYKSAHKTALQIAAILHEQQESTEAIQVILNELQDLIQK